MSTMDGTTIALLRKIRAKGVRGVCRAVADRVEESVLEPYLEWRLGISTTGWVSCETLGYQHPDWDDYSPSSYGNIRRIMRALDIRPGRDVFIDFGSGKGRVIVMAARHPFERVIGVDSSAALNAEAQRNIERARPRLACQQVDVVTADAAAYQVPDAATMIYFASPFNGGTLDAVLDNARTSLMRMPRRLSVVSHGYDAANPFESRLRKCGWLALRSEVLLQRSNCAWIYTNSRWAEPAARRAV
jgi:SAM-dependent methyltransferase